MQLTQQIKIKPTTEQEVVLNTLSEKCRLIYNFSLKERKEAFKNKLEGINYIKQQNDLPELKTKYPEYSWVYSKVLQYTLRILDADYKSFFQSYKEDKNAKLPKFKGKKYFTTMVYNQSGFKHKKGFIELSYKHPAKIKLLFKIPDKFIFEKIYQIAIYKKDNKDFYLSVTYQKPELEYKDNKLYQAFDLGVTKHTAVNSKGKFIEFINKRPDRYWEDKIQKAQSRRDHCKKKSNRWNLLNKNLKLMKRKSANQLKDSQHKLSRKIVDNTKANTIILGKLETKKLSQKNKYSKGLHKSLQNTGNISRFVRFLTYKTKLIGKRAIEINERGTSKKCCVCGKLHNMPLYKRIMICDCGNLLDRDKNSTVNIMSKFLSQNGMWTSYQQFAGNLRQTGLTIDMARYSQEAPFVR